MANLAKSERNFFYPKLVERDGEKCSKCGKTRTEVKILEIHETAYDRPLRLENMKLLCHGCNHLLEVRKKNIIRTQSITAEHKKSITAFPLFIKWLKSEIEKPENNYHMPYDQAIDQGAYEVGMLISLTPLSPETTKRYVSVLSDFPNSPYVTRADNHGEMNLWTRGKEPPIEL